MCENVQTKGRRYITEARLLIEHVDRQTVRASCRGNGAIYELGYDNGRWFCTCAALGRCSHLVALQLVTVPARVLDTRKGDPKP